MQTYNRIMLYFWLIIAVVIFVFVITIYVDHRWLEKMGFLHLFW
jgi:hypothetical protein